MRQPTTFVHRSSLRCAAFPRPSPSSLGRPDPPPWHDRDRRHVAVDGPALAGGLRQPGKPAARHHAAGTPVLREFAAPGSGRRFRPPSAGRFRRRRALASATGRFRPTASVISRRAQINIFCKKAAAVPYGTHTIFIGEAETRRRARSRRPADLSGRDLLLFRADRNQGRLAASAAPPGQPIDYTEEPT